MRRLQLLHRIAAQLIQHRARRKWRAGDFQFHFRQLVRRISQPPQLRAQVLFVDRAISRRAQRRVAIHRHAHRAHRPHGAQRFAFVRRHAQLHRLLAERRRRLRIHARRLVDIGIVRAPDQIAAADAIAMDRAVAEAQFAALDLKDAPAFFRLLGTAPVGRIEHHAVARLERRHAVRLGGLDQNPAVGNLQHAPHQHAAMARGAPFHHRLMIRPGEEERAEAARIHLLQPQFGGAIELQFPPGPGLVHRLAIGGGSQRHVIGVLVAAFDFQRGDADVDDLRHLLQRVEIARGKQVARVAQRPQLAIHHHLVRQAAGLRALPAIGAAPAPGLRREALAGVRHAQRAVDEDLQFAIGSFADGAHFGQRQLARQRDPADAEALRQAHAIGAGDAHLRAAVDFQVGRDLLRHAHHAHVLHDQGVRARLGNLRQRARGFVQFVVEDQRVESDVALDAAPVQGRHDLRQFRQRKPHLGARREVFEPEIHGVRARLDRGAQLWPVSGGTHDFRFTEGGHRDYYQRSIRERI